MGKCTAPKLFPKGFDSANPSPVRSIIRPRHKEVEMTFVTKRAAFAVIKAAGLVTASLAGCNRGGSSSSGSTGGQAAKRACIMLPDAASSSRWENGDRPALQKAFTAQGVQTDIQNAQNDTAKFATLADQKVTKGCSVMLLV